MEFQSRYTQVGDADQMENCPMPSYSSQTLHQGERVSSYNKRECISIHVGQAGVQMANACWELYCMEHGIGKDGYLCEEDAQCSGALTPGCDSFFSVTEGRRYVPRAILVDLEPTVVGEFLSDERFLCEVLD
ncbi:hypothetical protein J6590_007952 [Homalodisca vitripennis]|nr:hypothetical protein J6590_007952 [Homalodisca vitripennis]